MNAYGTPILSPLWDQADGPLGRMSVNPRYIRTWNPASSTYGALNDPIILAAGDTIEIEFSSTTTATLKEIIDGIIQFDAGDLLQLTNCTATIDGVSVASGASIAAYLDGAIHTIILTMSGADTATYIGSSAVPSNYFSGEILSVKFIDNSGAIPVVTNYVIDNDSTLYTQARGYSLGNENAPDFSSYADQSEAQSDGWVLNAGWSFDPIGKKFDSDGTVSGLIKTIPILANTPTVWEGNISGVTTGSLLLVYDGVTVGTVTSNGIYRIEFTANAAGNLKFDSTGGWDGSVEQFSLRQAESGALVYTNFISGDIEQFIYNYQTRCWEAAVHADICYV